MNFKKTVLILGVAVAILISGCGKSGDNKESQSSQESDNSTSSVVQVTELKVDDMFSERDNAFGYDSASANKIQLSETVTIKGEGTYVFSGNLSDGQIIVDADSADKIQLVLNGVNITSKNSAPIYIKQADKVFITLEKDSENILTNTTSFSADGETNVDGVIFSKDDLTINGSGSLKISSVDHGIVSKDDLVITGGKYNINSESHALSGKDSIRIGGGVFDIVAGKDALHSENTEDGSLGYIYVSGCELSAKCEGDGLDASGILQIDNGKFELVTGGGAVNAKVQTEKFGRFLGYDSTQDTEDSVSSKGAKANNSVIINNGKFIIDSSDDAMHSNSKMYILGGEFEIKTGDDGFHADDNLTVSGGIILISQSYEGLEGLTIDLTGGEIDLTASDDGINAAGGNDQSGFGGFGGQMRPDAFGAASDSYIKISGGIIRINASGDGIDSNGDLYVSGGETYVSGPTNNGNGALDYGSSAEVSGGVFIAVGASGMSAGFSSASNQGAIMLNANGNKGASITLIDNKGNEIFSFVASKNFGSVVLSHPEIKKGGKYTLLVGDKNYDIEMTDIIYGSSGGMSGFGGGPSGGNMKPGKHF